MTEIMLLRPMSEFNVTLTGTDQGDIIQIVGDGGVTVYGGEGNDVIDGGGGRDTIYGGDGADVIDGGAGQRHNLRWNRRRYHYRQSRYGRD